MLFFFKYGDGVAIQRQIIGAAQTRGAGADDGNTLIAIRMPLLRHIAPVGGELLRGDKFLDLVDSDRGVDLPTHAGVLAAAVADASADGGQRVLELDKL